MMSPETARLIAAFKSDLLSVLKDIKHEVSHLLDDGVSQYIETHKVKFEKTKTFLFRNEQINFYDSYFPLSINCKQHTVDSDRNIFEIFERSNCAAILGGAGSGKTMLLKHMFLQCVSQVNFIPIPVELRSFNDQNLSFNEFIHQTFYNNKLSPNANILERTLSSGHFLFLLDGFDEIYSKTKQKMIKELDAFIDRYPSNKYLLTSRPGTNIENLPRFETYKVLPLTPIQIKHFVAKQVSIAEDIQLGDKILETIGKQENKDFKAYLGSPLLLSMFILTYNAYPELPKSKSKFYWNVFDTLCTKHDSLTKKGGYQHERKSGLMNEDFETILKWFGYISFFEGRYNFDSQYISQNLNDLKKSLDLKYNTDLLIEDLTVSISLIILDGLEYKFPHKSLQEYFAALLIKEQSEEAKALIYSEQFKQSAFLAFGGHENFWNLCEELDKHNFYTHFIIPQLRKLLDELREREPVEKAIYLYSQNNITDMIGYNPATGIAKFLGRTSYVGNLYMNLLPFAGLRSLESILSLTRNESVQCQRLLKDFVEKGLLRPNNLLYQKDFQTFSCNYNSLGQSNLSDLIKTTRIVDEVLIFEDKLKKRISELETEIDKAKKNKMSLLTIKGLMKK